MEPKELVFLFDYNRWANARVLRACQDVPAEALFAPAQCSFGSLMGTLAHTYGAEVIWRLRLLEHKPPTRIANAADFASLAELRVQWSEEEARMQRQVAALTHEDLDRWVEYSTLTGKPQGSTLWKGLVHLVMHGMQFRSEAGMLLSALGHSPGDLDFIFFQRETDQR